MPTGAGGRHPLACPQARPSACIRACPHSAARGACAERGVAKSKKARMPPSAEFGQALGRIRSLLERYRSDGVIDGTAHELLLSKYRKAHEVLTQSLSNEAVHLHNIQDVARSIEATEQTLQAESRRQTALSQQILKLRMELSEREAALVNVQDEATKLAAEDTMLQEERMLLAQELESRRHDYAESLRPRILVLEHEGRAIRDGMKSLDGIEASIASELALARAQLDTLVAANDILGDEHRKVSSDCARAALLPDKYQRQSALVQQALSTAQADADKRGRRLQDADAALGIVQQAIDRTNAEVASTGAATRRLRAESVVALTQEAEGLLRELRQARARHRLLGEEAAVLAMKETTVRAARHMDAAAAEGLERETRAQAKRIARAEMLIGRATDAQAPLQRQISEAAGDARAEEAREQGLRRRLEALRASLNRDALALASGLSAGDEYAARLAEAVARTRALQGELGDAAATLRALAIQAVAETSARAAAAARVSRTGAQLKQALARLQVKDTEADRLAVELHALESRMREYDAIYERVKTQKNRLARLSQEARLAIREVREKIAILASETGVLAGESQQKSAALARQARDTRDAQRLAGHNRQALANQRRDLRAVHDRVARQILEIDSLGTVITAAEQEIFQLKELYVGAIEQRNYAGIQLIERNDELCLLYEKLHTQETIARDAEVYMGAREGDIRTLRLAVADAERERDVARAAAEQELPRCVEERARLLAELAEAQAGNEQLLLDLRTSADVVDGAQTTHLDLSGTYAGMAGDTGDAGGAGGAVRRPGDPPAALPPIGSAPALGPGPGPAQDDAGAGAGTGAESAERAEHTGHTARTAPQTPQPKALSRTARAERAPASAGGSQAAIARSKLPGRRLTVTWNLVGPAAGTGADAEELRGRQDALERRLQAVREQLLERFIFDEELDRLVATLRKDLEEAQREVPPETVARLNGARGQLRAVTRKLMCVVSEISMEQATILKLREVTEQLEDTVVAARDRLARGDAPTDEVAHEWLVAHQNEVDYQYARMLREQEYAAQVPGLAPSTANPRFDSYMSEETGLPRPYGGKAPFAPADPSPNVGRFVRKPAPMTIEI